LDDANAPGRRLRSSTAIIVLVLVMIVTQMAGFIYTQRLQNELYQLRFDTRELRIAQQALVDAEAGVKDYVATRDTGFLQSYFVAVSLLDSKRDGVLRNLDSVANQYEAERGRRPSYVAIERLHARWREAIRLTRDGNIDRARDMLTTGDARRMVVEVRAAMSRFLDEKGRVGALYEERINLATNIVMVLQVVGGALAVVGLFFGFRAIAAETRRRRTLMVEAVKAREQVEHLFSMTSKLQSASTYDDANEVLRATVNRLLPGISGSLYILNNSRDRLELSTSWNPVEGIEPPESVAPSDCWALKLGKTQVNSRDPGALRCAHIQHADAMTLEMPMVARGEINGMLCLLLREEMSERAIAEITTIATALSDAVSLALSNIQLREKLRNQALRDQLTGLYNRRYMEDMLDRLIHLAERNQRPMAVIMVDLDNFKRLNDQHGHAMGDTVLREAAAAIAASLRQSDIACRYGGEELIVLLPDCDMVDAAAKAEQLRQRIEALSQIHGMPISASFGVAATPESASAVSQLLAAADAALYDAKRHGRNRVELASRRPTALAAE